MTKCTSCTKSCDEKSVLTIEQIAESIEAGRLLRWHPDYRREGWCDGPDPLRPTSIMKLSENSYYVGYICSKSECGRCKHPISTWSEHHKVIRANGLDMFGRGEERPIGKNKTEMVVVDQPVFAACEENDVENS